MSSYFILQFEPSAEQVGQCNGNSRKAAQSDKWVLELSEGLSAELFSGELALTAEEAALVTQTTEWEGAVPNA